MTPMATVKLCLSKLEGELVKKLQQIKEFMEVTGAGADHGIVFFSGIDQWEPEWGVTWSTLGSDQERWVWQQVKSVQENARATIGMPFDLIVGRYTEHEPAPGGEMSYGPIEYSPFPWNPKEL